MDGGMDRVVITAPVVGICHMQVCAVPEVGDEEILEVCNQGNPSGTTHGWSHVIRENEPSSDFWPIEKFKPVQCSMHPEGKHSQVVC
jgi:hypothetical protein